MGNLCTLHESIVESVPKLKRGLVWCHTCGMRRAVDSARCLREGWPTCCGYTMSIDSPSERRQLVADAQATAGREGLDG